MAVKEGPILRMLASLLGGVLGGIQQGLATGFGGTGTGVASRILEGAAPGTVAEYPERTRPFTYNVDFIETDPKTYKPNFNSMYKANPNPRYMRMQSLDEHNRALNKYIRPGMTPLQLEEAIRRGQEEERNLKSFWVNDDRPRSDAAKSSSTAVSNVQVNEDGTISVQFRQNGKWYTYGGGPTAYDAAMAAHDLVTANSIGQAINPEHGWWSVGNHHQLWKSDRKRAAKKR